VVEIDERVGVGGEVLTPLDELQSRRALQSIRDAGVDALAIVLMHGWRHADHERRLAEIARELGFGQISVSHEVAPLIKLVGRGDTTVVDAYLSPILRRYVDRVAAGLPDDADLHFMQSNGGLAEATAFRGKDAILSGPAGGVVGMVAASAPHGDQRLIGFDMGGTSTDVSHYAGRFELADESVVAGVRIRAPMMQIHTVAAGGGSICRFDGMRFRVGPESAGANPGPACYRNGGPLTVTDCNLYLRRIDPERFPRVFGPGGDQPLDRDASTARLQEVADAVGSKSLEEIAHGFLEIAVDNMAAAIRKISIARGHDVTRYTLACFGGAGGQHACAVADALGMERILIHSLAGVLSAYGIGIADVKAIRETSRLRPLDEDFSEALSELEQKAREALIEQGLRGERIELLRRARLRTAGSDTTLEIAVAAAEKMRADFSALHRQRFGYWDQGVEVIVDALVVEAVGHTFPPLDFEGRGTAEGGGGAPPSSLRDATSPANAGEEIVGPSLIFEPTSTIVVEPGWCAERAEIGRASCRERV